MNIQGLFQFMSSEQGNSFFCDVTPENSADFLDQLMQNSEFTTLAREYVADDSVLRQKIVTKIGQMCKKMKKPKEDAVPLPVVETSKPKLVDGYELIRVQYAIDDAAYLRENTVEESIYVPDIDESLGQRAYVPCCLQQLTQKVTKSPDELGTHIGEGIYLQQEGHVFKMTTPQFVVYY